MENGLLKYAFLWNNRIIRSFFLKSHIKTAKMKLPLHKLSFVKATAPLIYYHTDFVRYINTFETTLFSDKKRLLHLSPVSTMQAPTPSH